MVVFSSYEMEKIRDNFSIDSPLLEESSDSQLTAVRKFILELNSCFGDHIY